MQNITQSWFVQGMIKATTDAWLKGWDERNGGNLTLRLDDADIALYHDNFHPGIVAGGLGNVLPTSRYPNG